MTTLKILRRLPEAVLPTRGHASDAGLDLTAVSVEMIRPGVFAFDTGISIQTDPGYYCEVVPRSSIIKTDFMLANSVGIIDPDYRGPIRVILRYLGEGEGAFEAGGLVGNRIAQLIVRRVEPVDVVEVTSLDETPRGAGGFGSTGD